MMKNELLIITKLLIAYFFQEDEKYLIKITILRKEFCLRNKIVLLNSQGIPFTQPNFFIEFNKYLKFIGSN